MKSADKYRLAQDMPIHRIHDLSTNLRGVRALRRLRNVKLRVESIQFERVMVIWTRRSTRAHIASATQAYLQCAIGYLTPLTAFRKTGGCCRNIPCQPVQDICLRAFL